MKPSSQVKQKLYLTYCAISSTPQPRYVFLILMLSHLIFYRIHFTAKSFTKSCFHFSYTSNKCSLCILCSKTIKAAKKNIKTEKPERQSEQNIKAVIGAALALTLSKQRAH